MAVSFLAAVVVVVDLMGAAVVGLASAFLARSSVLPVLDELLRTSALMTLGAGRGLASASLELALLPECCSLPSGRPKP
jgi:hypothetical protein